MKPRSFSRPTGGRNLPGHPRLTQQADTVLSQAVGLELNPDGAYVGAAQGKLFILGEYAVVTHGQPAVLAAVDRTMSIELREAAGPGYIHEQHRGRSGYNWQTSTAEVVERHTKSGRDYLLRALDVAQRYVQSAGKPMRYADVYIQNQLIDDTGKKLGLGSSAAIVVATLQAVLKFYGLQLPPLQLYKLSMLVSVQVSPQSSGGDLAAAIYGGWIAYHSPDRDWLMGQRSKLDGPELFDLLTTLWPGLNIGRISPPQNFDLHVGWTKTPASSPELVTALTGAAGSHQEASEIMRTFNEQSRALVARFIAGDITAITAGRKLMGQMGRTRNVQIETPQLTSLCDVAEKLGGFAKVSGAGGGDCGIAFLPQGRPDLAEKLHEQWHDAGIVSLQLRVAEPLANLSDYNPEGTAS